MKSQKFQRFNHILESSRQSVSADLAAGQLLMRASHTHADPAAGLSLMHAYHVRADTAA